MLSPQTDARPVSVLDEPAQDDALYVPLSAVNARLAAAERRLVEVEERILYQRERLGNDPALLRRALDDAYGRVLERWSVLKRIGPAFAHAGWVQLHAYLAVCIDDLIAAWDADRLGDQLLDASARAVIEQEAERDRAWLARLDSPTALQRRCEWMQQEGLPQLEDALARCERELPPVAVAEFESDI